MTMDFLKELIDEEMAGGDYLQLMVTESGLLFRCEAWCICCEFLIADDGDLHDALRTLIRMVPPLHAVKTEDADQRFNYYRAVLLSKLIRTAYYEGIRRVAA